MLLYYPNLDIFNKKFSEIKKINSIWDFNFSFPEFNPDFIVSLEEGSTPCLGSKNIGEILGIKHLYFKDETKNPTNSFKDRAAALLISHARSWEFHRGQ